MAPGRGARHRCPQDRCAGAAVQHRWRLPRGLFDLQQRHRLLGCARPELPDAGPPHVPEVHLDAALVPADDVREDQVRDHGHASPDEQRGLHALASEALAQGLGPNGEGSLRDYLRRPQRAHDPHRRGRADNHRGLLPLRVRPLVRRDRQAHARHHEPAHAPHGPVAAAGRRGQLGDAGRRLERRAADAPRWHGGGAVCVREHVCGRGGLPLGGDPRRPRQLVAGGEEGGLHPPAVLRGRLRVQRRDGELPAAVLRGAAAGELLLRARRL
mmetsp:Transcript_32741/g.86490  ORF Transcript_32741/g.86490 Transcript_32741/m.86490 type:complete len:270 (+) Transcript_32741:298-1107(+)